MIGRRFSEQAVDNWTRVAVALPEEHERVLCYSDSVQFVGVWEYGRWWVDPPTKAEFILPGVFLGGGPSHWMTLPAPPGDCDA